MNAGKATSMAMLWLGASACAHGMSVNARMQELSAVTSEAREHGAYRCAPEELARAEAELEFARAELALGDRARADEHVVRASANARAALRLSGDARCREAETSSPEARLFAPTGSISMTRLTSRRGSTKDHAAS